MQRFSVDLIVYAQQRPMSIDRCILHEGLVNINRAASLRRSEPSVKLIGLIGIGAVGPGRVCGLGYGPGVVGGFHLLGQVPAPVASVAVEGYRVGYRLPLSVESRVRLEFRRGKVDLRSVRGGGVPAVKGVIRKGGSRRSRRVEASVCGGCLTCRAARPVASVGVEGHRVGLGCPVGVDRCVRLEFRRGKVDLRSARGGGVPAVEGVIRLGRRRQGSGELPVRPRRSGGNGAGSPLGSKVTVYVAAAVQWA